MGNRNVAVLAVLEDEDPKEPKRQRQRWEMFFYRQLHGAAWCRWVQMPRPLASTACLWTGCWRWTGHKPCQCWEMLGDVGRLPRPAELAATAVCHLVWYIFVNWTNYFYEWRQHQNTAITVGTRVVQFLLRLSKQRRTPRNVPVLVWMTALFWCMLIDWSSEPRRQQNIAQLSTTRPQLYIRTQLNWLIRTYYFGKLSELRICEALATSSSFNPTFAVQRWNVETCGNMWKQQLWQLCAACHRSSSLREKPTSPRRSTFGEIGWISTNINW